VSANDRLRDTGRVTYFRDIGLQGLPLPFGGHGSCVRPSVAAGIAGLAASASSVPAAVSSGADLRGGYPCPAAKRPTVLPATQRERHGKTPRRHTVTDRRLGSPEICIGRTGGRAKIIQFGRPWPSAPSTAFGYGHRFGGSAWAHQRAQELVDKIRAAGVELIGRVGC